MANALIEIHTSEPGWMERLARAYKNRRPGVLIDDASIGIDPEHQTILEMARQARLSTREFAAVCIALGMSVAGLAMIGLAIMDPELTSKLSLLVGGGVVCVLSGGFTAIRILTHHRPPNVKVGKGTFEFSWD